MNMHGTSSKRVVKQQDTSHHITLDHGAGDAAVRDEVLDGLLLALGRHILDDLQTLVRYLVTILKMLEKIGPWHTF